MVKCKLCLKDEADKENSHIIPKFMGKRLFEKSKPRHSLLVQSQGKLNKIQDTPKEDHIFCTRCENRFAYLENYFSRKLKSIHNYGNEKENFKIQNYRNLIVLECFRVPYNAMKLFNYSLVWKASASSLEEFKKFKLPNFKEEELRKFLDLNLPDSYSELKKNLLEIQDDTNFNSYFFKCVVRNDYSRGVFTAYQLSESLFGLFLVDIIVFFSLEKSEIPLAFKVLSDIQKENTLIRMVEIPEWKRLNYELLKGLIRK